MELRSKDADSSLAENVTKAENEASRKRSDALFSLATRYKLEKLYQGFATNIVRKLL